MMLAEFIDNKFEKKKQQKKVLEFPIHYHRHFITTFHKIPSPLSFSTHYMTMAYATPQEKCKNKTTKKINSSPSLLTTSSAVSMPALLVLLFVAANSCGTPFSFSITYVIKHEINESKFGSIIHL